MIDGLTFGQRRKKVLEDTGIELTPHNLSVEEKQTIKDMVDSLETITYFKHHYVRKTMLKKILYSLVSKMIEERQNEQTKIL